MLHLGHRAAGWSVCALFLAATVACAGSPPPTTQISQVGQPPIGGFVSSDSATLPLGVIIGFSVQSSGAQGSGTAAVRVDDPAVASLEATTDPSTYVVFGVRTGQTTLHATAPGASETTMLLVVTQQTPAP